MAKDINRRDSFSNRREDIIQAAAELFHRKGFHGTSIGDIAKEVGLPKGGLYYYIESKEELLFEITTRGIRNVLPVLKQIKESDLEPAEKLVQAVKNNTNMLAAYQEYVSVFLQERNSLLPEHYQKYIKDRDEVEWIFRDIIQQGVDKGIFRQTNVKVITFAVLGMCNWITQWYRPDGNVSAAEIAELFADVTYRMLKN
ncbi:TetR/AcrR family transcriptional regulator [Paradesulfitobacterium aromaticivorans]